MDRTWYFAMVLFSFFVGVKSFFDGELCMSIEIVIINHRFDCVCVCGGVSSLSSLSLSVQT